MHAAATPTTGTRRPRRRRAALVGALALVPALALAARSSSGDDTAGGSDGPATPEFCTYSLKGTDPVAQALVDRYHELNPDVTAKLS